jgi:clathrin heavy chain
VHTALATQHQANLCKCLTSVTLVQLSSIGVTPEFISFKNVTMESEKYICIRETGAQNTVVIVDMTNPMSPARRQISADSALMCLDKKVIALKAAAAGTPGDNLQIFNLESKQKLKAFTMPELVEYWKWITPTRLGLVTAGSVYHWEMEVGQLLLHVCFPHIAFAERHLFNAGHERSRESV